MNYALWALLIVAQAAAQTFVSRARNSESYKLHTYASLFSNGVWIVQQFVSLNIVIEAIKRGSLLEQAVICAIYAIIATSGSVGMHWAGVNYIEHRLK